MIGVDSVPASIGDLLFRFLGEYMVTAEELRELFSYDPETGTLKWKNILGTKITYLIGYEAGYLTATGYRAVSINNKSYLVHRVIWCLINGHWPNCIDHRDGNPANNRLSNLRNGTQSHNHANRDKLQRGVEKHGRKYRARIKFKHVRTELGSFDTREEAQAAFDIAADKIYGEFARINR